MDTLSRASMTLINKDEEQTLDPDRETTYSWVIGNHSVNLQQDVAVVERGLIE